jgi:SAM-dependent MidA family methyltransferase
MVPWKAAWSTALYGPHGFYRGDTGPAGHFTTSSHGPLGAVLAEALGVLADREGATHVVDVGCARGELLVHLHSARPDLRLTGVDVVERPSGLPGAISWLSAPGGATLPDALVDLEDALVVAHEWLDVVPCTIAEVVGPGRLALVLVDPVTGVETPAAEGPADEDLAWCARHWPVEDRAVGSRVEVGLARDRAWADLASRVRRGTMLAVDYGHTRDARPAGGTLTAYRAGRIVDAVPDGSCDLTAHVAVDSLEHDELTTQRDALRSLGIDTRPPAPDLASSDPSAYLAGLVRSSAAAALTEEHGLGRFRWVYRRIDAA